MHTSVIVNALDGLRCCAEEHLGRYDFRTLLVLIVGVTIGLGTEEALYLHSVGTSRHVFQGLTDVAGGVSKVLGHTIAVTQAILRFPSYCTLVEVGVGDDGCDVELSRRCCVGSDELAKRSPHLGVFGSQFLLGGDGWQQVDGIVQHLVEVLMFSSLNGDFLETLPTLGHLVFLCHEDGVFVTNECQTPVAEDSPTVIYLSWDTKFDIHGQVVANISIDLNIAIACIHDGFGLIDVVWRCRAGGDGIPVA